MCLLNEEEENHSQSGDKQEQYHRFRGDYPDIFPIRALNALLVGRSCAPSPASSQAGSALSYCPAGALCSEAFRAL